MKHDSELESRITAAFEEVGNALIHLLSAAEKSDWEARHRAAEELGQAAAGVYRSLCEDGSPGVGSA